MAKDIQCEVRNIISEIEEKAADGNYIYRGEPGGYEQPSFDGKVSSSLWRQFRLAFKNREAFENKRDFNKLQESYLRNARRYDKGGCQDDFEFASQLQHLGGKTNLIDFTRCHLVALFFACDGAHKKPGRVILFELTDDKRSRYKIKPPLRPAHRVEAQKSVFVQHPNGVIEEDDIEEIICIEPSFKEPILTYLREEEGIYTQEIYNDLQGYIKHQKNHHDAYSVYRQGELARLSFSIGITSIDGIALADVAIKRLNKAIELDPLFVEAYFERAHVYWSKDNFDKAIEDFTSAIDLNPDHALTHFQRGKVYRCKGCYDRAIEDFNRAIKFDPDDAFVYAERGLAYFDNGCYDRAIKDFNRAIELGDNRVRGHLEAAQTRRESEGADEVESVN